MRNERLMIDPVFVVTDIEADGPVPGVNSMRAFASVAVGLDGTERGAFEAVLQPLEGSTPDAKTLGWFKSQPEAWAAATRDARPPEEVMEAYVDWVGGFTGGRIFTAYPLAFDGIWIDHYLRRFTSHALVEGHYVAGRLFDGSGLCLKSFAAALTRRPPWDCPPSSLPKEWFGGFEHSHRAIDDARGYASLLGVLRTIQARTKDVPDIR
jgi:DNA polymerase III, epsilon subunit and related 3''-5'' exonucleases